MLTDREADGQMEALCFYCWGVILLMLCNKLEDNGANANDGGTTHRIDTTHLVSWIISWRTVSYPAYF